MKRFIEGADRSQSTLLPECLDDWVDESNSVRAVDAFVDALNLAELGFDDVEPAPTGRPGYHPAVLLKQFPQPACEGNIDPGQLAQRKHINQISKVRPSRNGWLR